LCGVLLAALLGLDIGLLGCATSYAAPHFTLVKNIKRDPFEQAVTLDGKTAPRIGGELASPSTAGYCHFLVHSSNR
jgi:hypothetical protein